MRFIAVIILALLFFPAVGLIAQFTGNLSLAACAYYHSPGFIISHEDVERITFEANEKAKLMAKHNTVFAKRLQLRLNCNENEKEWKKSASKSITELNRLLLCNPPLPIIETRVLFESNGKMDNPFTLAVNQKGNEPLRTLAHELTHFYLLWALIPGLPVDCPRWFNEGLAEFVSGNVVGDKKGWNKFALINRSALVPLSIVSPAFSWQGWREEQNAKDAVALLIDMKGENIFRRLVLGLRFARPFYSVYQIVTGSTFSSFEKQWLEYMKRKRVLENQSPNEIARKTLWIAENKGIIELEGILKATLNEYISKERKTYLMDIAKLHEASRLYDVKKFTAALGWLRGVNKHIPGVTVLYNQIVASLRQNKDYGSSEKKTDVLLGYKKYLWLRNMNSILVWLIAISFGMLVVGAYSFIRRKLVPFLTDLWECHESLSLAFRWTVVGLTGLGGAWFLRFLVISMIPYSGLAAISDFNRIIMAEVLVIILWFALDWQLRKWDSICEIKQNLPDQNLNSKFNKVVLFYLFFVLIPPILAAWQNGWERTGITFFQTIVSLSIFVVSSAAFSVAIWGAAQRWSRCFSQKNYIFPAIIYALFRGGLLADPWGSLFALVVGYRLTQLALYSKSVFKPFLIDALFVMPALLISVGWFPSTDPLAGIWYGGDKVIIWWLIPTLILLWFPFPLTKSNSNDSIQIAKQNS